MSGRIRMSILLIESFTVEAWAQRRSSGTMDMIVTQGNGAPGTGLMFGYHWNWVGFVFDFYGDGVVSLDGYDDPGWHHWAGSYDASTKARHLYRDGLLVASNVALQRYQGSGPLFIGRAPFDDPACFDGGIDEVRIWNVARTAEQIAENMWHPLSGAEPGLMAYWRFDEGTGADTLDATANAFNAVLVNGPSWTNSTLPQAPANWGNALSLDGNDDRVQISALTSFPATNITVEFWMRTSDASKQGTPLCYATSTSDNSFLLLDYRNFQIHVAGQASAASGVSANDGQWHHIAATWSSASGACQLYRDGILRFQTTLAAGATCPPGAPWSWAKTRTALGADSRPPRHFSVGWTTSASGTRCVIRSRFGTDMMPPDDRRGTRPGGVLSAKTRRPAPRPTTHRQSLGRHAVQ